MPDVSLSTTHEMNLVVPKTFRYIERFLEAFFLMLRCIEAISRIYISFDISKEILKVETHLFDASSRFD